MLLHTRARLLTHRHLFLVSNGAELSCPPRTKNKTKQTQKRKWLQPFPGISTEMEHCIQGEPVQMNGKVWEAVRHCGKHRWAGGRKDQDGQDE